MELFKTYKLWDIEPIKGLGTTLWDKDGAEYTDLYGGHAVISIGHSHPHYVKMLSDQLTKLGFYSNAVQNSLQKELARRLGKISGYDDYSLFLCNSGAEANENAMKLASFHTGRSSIQEEAGYSPSPDHSTEEHPAQSQPPTIRSSARLSTLQKT